jgi:hypothetical protein
VGVSCEWVLYMVYSGSGAHEAADRHYKMFKDRLDETSIEVDSDSDGTADVVFSGGALLLG